MGTRQIFFTAWEGSDSFSLSIRERERRRGRKGGRNDWVRSLHEIYEEECWISHLLPLILTHFFSFTPLKVDHFSSSESSRGREEDSLFLSVLFSVSSYNTGMHYIRRNRNLPPPFPLPLSNFTPVRHHYFSLDPLIEGIVWISRIH